MKTILVLLTCALAVLTFAPPAEAGYRREIVGYDLRGNPIIRVIWVADHLDYPRTIYDRRTYPTSWRRDPQTLWVPSMIRPRRLPQYVDPESSQYIQPER